MVEDDARRRIAEEKGPDHVADVAIRPTIDRLDFTAARKADLEEMRREIYPLARRLATRLTQEHHARRRGPLDFRRTVRASISTGGVPLVTHHKPKRPHRTELVVLCDVSGSVANFAQFTLLLVFALRDQFQKVRAFTFIDHVHEVTHHFRPGADVVDVMADLAASTSHAALWGRTNYGRAFTKFAEQYADALGPRSSLLILGDARSNYSDLPSPVLRELAGSARHAWWLNPEHTRHWDTGDSAAGPYGEVVPMVECRNLTQLGEFVHDILLDACRASRAEVARGCCIRSISALSSGWVAVRRRRGRRRRTRSPRSSPPPSKTTVSRLRAAGVDQRAEHRDRVGAVLEREHAGGRRGSAAPCADGAPAVTTWSITNAGEVTVAATSAAVTPPCAEPTSITWAPWSPSTAFSIARTTWPAYAEWSPPTSRSRRPLPPGPGR